MIWFFIGMSVVYLIFMLAMIVSWYKIPGNSTSTDQSTLMKISVIVPVRNEAKHIARLLDQIRTQDYTSSPFEIIIVNDHSTDDTVAIVEKFKEKNGISLHLINLEDLKEGKKAALTEGIYKANGEIIVTTDGDCEVGNEWLSTVVNRFDDETKMVFGPVAIRGNTFFDKLQMMDFAGLIGVGGATWQMGLSGMCNGANLAFRKDVFQECNGYEGSELYPSGDDEFLLRKVHDYYPKGIRFVKSKSAVVFTGAQATIKSFVHQRIRWAGKWKLHHDLATKLLAIFIFSFYALMLIVTGRSLLFFYEDINIVISIWGVKWLLDVVLVGSVLKLSNQRLFILESIILSLIYPFYAIGIGISTINYTFEWKGRKY